MPEDVSDTPSMPFLRQTVKRPDVTLFARSESCRQRRDVGDKSKHVFRNPPSATAAADAMSESVVVHVSFREKGPGQQTIEEQQRKGSQSRSDEAFATDRVDLSVSPEEQHGPTADNAAADAHQHCANGTTGIPSGHDGFGSKAGERAKSHPAQQLVETVSDDLDDFSF